MKKIKRQFKAEEKVAILKRHLCDKETVSDICEEIKLAPNLFYRWQKEFFENGAVAFQRNGQKESSKVRHLEKENERLQNRITQKESVIAEITEDYVKLKKNLGET